MIHHNKIDYFDPIDDVIHFHILTHGRTAPHGRTTACVSQSVVIIN
jgi:hypothetical protein